MCVCACAHTGAWWTSRRGTEQRPRPSALSLRKCGGSERTWRWTPACLNLSVAQGQGSSQAAGRLPRTPHGQGPAQERLRHLLHGKIWARSRSLSPSPSPPAWRWEVCRCERLLPHAAQRRAGEGWVRARAANIQHEARSGHGWRARMPPRRRQCPAASHVPRLGGGASNQEGPRAGRRWHGVGRLREQPLPTRLGVTPAAWEGASLSL